MTRHDWTYNDTYGPGAYQPNKQDYFSPEQPYKPRQPSLPSVSMLISMANPGYMPGNSRQPEGRSELPPVGQPGWQSLPRGYSNDVATQRRPGTDSSSFGFLSPTKTGAHVPESNADACTLRAIGSFSGQRISPEHSQMLDPPSPLLLREECSSFDNQADPYALAPRQPLGYAESRSAGTSLSSYTLASDTISGSPPKRLSISNLLDRNNNNNNNNNDSTMSSTVLSGEPLSAASRVTAYTVPGTPTHGELQSPVSPLYSNPTYASPQAIPMETPMGTASPTRFVKQVALPGTTEYHLFVRQQPVAGRMCGYGERDRRVIDPPPILQLTLDDPAMAPEELTARLRGCQCVVYCTIWDATGTVDKSRMEDYQEARRLMGTTVSSSFMGFDEYGVEGCFFPFPDLSCRTSGAYRLKFSLVVLGPAKPWRGQRVPFSAVATSDVFFVYSPREFPGMQPSSSLTHCLRDQGCMISLKKGNYNKNPGSGRRVSSLSDDDDGAE